MTDKRGGIIQVTLLCLLVIWTIICFQGVAGTSYGEGISTCPTRSDEDLKTQICPRNSNDRKYVRIKTYNGKYLWAYATNNGEKSFVRTRCCGKNDRVGRKDSKAPGTKTTFRVHCSSNKATVRFEVLTTRGRVNRGTGYFLYADKIHRWLYSERRPDANDPKSHFILKRWRGPMVAIKSARNAYWWSFIEDGHGYVLISKTTVRRYPDIPPMFDTFTLELVPRECVEVNTDERIIAAQDVVTPEECHRKPDRCYWTEGWQEGTRRNIKEGTCYYMKDSMCFQPTIRSRRGCPQRGAKDCEAANCCFDYQRNQCYRGTA